MGLAALPLVDGRLWTVDRGQGEEALKKRSEIGGLRSEGATFGGDSHSLRLRNEGDERWKKKIWRRGRRAGEEKHKESKERKMDAPGFGRGFEEEALKKRSEVGGCGFRRGFAALPLVDGGLWRNNTKNRKNVRRMLWGRGFTLASLPASR